MTTATTMTMIGGFSPAPIPRAGSTFLIPIFRTDGSNETFVQELCPDFRIESFRKIDTEAFFCEYNIAFGELIEVGDLGVIIYRRGSGSFIGERLAYLKEHFQDYRYILDDSLAFMFEASVIARDQAQLNSTISALAQPIDSAKAVADLAASAVVLENADSRFARMRGRSIHYELDKNWLRRPENMKRLDWFAVWSSKWAQNPGDSELVYIAVELISRNVQSFVREGDLLLRLLDYGSRADSQLQSRSGTIFQAVAKLLKREVSGEMEIAARRRFLAKAIDWFGGLYSELVTIGELELDNFVRTRAERVTGGILSIWFSLAKRNKISSMTREVVVRALEEAKSARDAEDAMKLVLYALSRRDSSPRLLKAALSWLTDNVRVSRDFVRILRIIDRDSVNSFATQRELRELPDDLDYSRSGSIARDSQAIGLDRSAASYRIYTQILDALKRESLIDVNWAELFEHLLVFSLPRSVSASLSSELLSVGVSALNELSSNIDLEGNTVKNAIRYKIKWALTYIGIPSRDLVRY